MLNLTFEKQDHREAWLREQAERGKARQRALHNRFLSIKLFQNVNVFVVLLVFLLLLFSSCWKLLSKISLLLLLLLLYLKNIIRVIQAIIMHRRLGSAEQETSRSRRTEVPVMRMKMMTMCAYISRHDKKKKKRCWQRKVCRWRRSKKSSRWETGLWRRTVVETRLMDSQVFIFTLVSQEPFSSSSSLHSKCSPLSWLLIVPPKHSGQQNPNKRADTRAETWKQSVMILSYYWCVDVNASYH